MDARALEQSINEIVKRHEALRTTFCEVDGEPVQVVAQELHIKLKKVDLTREADISKYIREEIEIPFELSRGPLFRGTLFKTGEDEYILVMTVHHILFDGWSRGVLVGEITALYRGIKSGQPYVLPELPVQYGDYSVWQNRWFEGEVREGMLSYWRKKLGGELPVLELPGDRPRPAVQTFNGDVCPVELHEELSEALRRMSREKGATLFITMLAAFKVLLYRHTGQEDIIVGTPIAGRNSAETEGLIGFFVNTLALRTDLSGSPVFDELLDRVRETTLDAYENQEMPFEKLVEELQPDPDMSRQPIFQVMFILQNTPTQEASAAGLELKSIETGSPARPNST